MSTSITATELDLLTFFESQPKKMDPDEVWIYNDCAYTYTDGKLQISFAVAPSYKDVRIIVADGERRIYELNAMEVHDVQYLSDGNGRNESLQVTLQTRDTVTVTLKPNIGISHVLASSTS